MTPRCWACDGPTIERVDYQPRDSPDIARWPADPRAAGQGLVPVKVRACIRPGCEVTEAAQPTEAR